MPNTKIVATLGPASDAPEKLRDLISAGVDVFRLNASHGEWPDHARRIVAVRAAAAEAGRHIGILLDLQGPKIRLGKFAGGSCILRAGARFRITTEHVLGTCDLASTGYAELAQDVKAGNRVLLADGAVELLALSSDGVTVEFEVVVGGAIGDRKGINLPGVQVSAPSVTEADERNLSAGLAAGVDMIAQSFVRTADDVRHLRSLMGQGAPVPIIAKIEKPEAYDNLQSILETADGVMVARGDLGVETSLERVPPMQKSIIRRARREGKFVITATQMLESMIERPTPTRAEVSDVANAIYDGTDAVMLSAETSVGQFPVETVRYMTGIAREAERSINKRGFQDQPMHGSDPTVPQVMATSAYHAARAAKVASIVVFTRTGRSAQLVSRYRPPVKIYAVTPSAEAARALSVCYGVIPVILPEVGSTDEMLAQMDWMLMERQLCQRGDTVVFVAGQPVGHAGTTNLMKIHKVGEIVEG